MSNEYIAWFWTVGGRKRIRWREFVEVEGGYNVTSEGENAVGA